jgi:hypothetical protein
MSFVIRGAGVGDADGDGSGEGVGVWAEVLSGSFVTTKPAAPRAGRSFTNVRRDVCVCRLIFAERCEDALLFLFVRFTGVS